MTCAPVAQDLTVVIALITFMAGLILGGWVVDRQRPPPAAGGD